MEYVSSEDIFCSPEPSDTCKKAREKFLAALPDHKTKSKEERAWSYLSSKIVGAEEPD